MGFVKGFEKEASIVGSTMKKLKSVKPETWDKAGLGLLAAAPAYHVAKAIKEKDSGQAALGATELGGLGMLYHAVRKAHA
jgi:hypothetical protein